MSIFKNLKKTLGFDNSDEGFGYEESYIDVKKRETQKNSENPKKVSQIVVESVESKSEVDCEKMKHEIFAQVVSIFNESLPQFLKSSVDEAAQKKYLYDALDVSVRSFIENIEVETRKSCEVRWHNERLSLATEIDGLKKVNKELELTKEESKKQQLSADRQKRALMTRVHDLEMQVSSFEAEKEQYELENRSLVNKLKASNVVDRDFEELRAENTKLQEELNNSKLQIAKLTSNENYTSPHQVLSNNEELAAQNEALTKQIEQLRVKEEMSDAIINELNEKASTSLRQLEELQAERETLKSSLEDAICQLQSKSTELSESKHELEILDQIQDEVLKFESIKSEKDSKINELEQEILHLNSQIKTLEEESESLKSTIEQNLYNQAISEDLLKKEINQLKELQKNVAPKKSKRKAITSNVKISAIDESIIDADWLISTPPEGTVTRPVSPTTGEDFGYQAPPKKTTPENEAQMSLW